MEELTTIVLSLGSNMGDRFSHLQQGINDLKSIGKIQAISRIYETPPLGFDAETSFLNLCLSIQSALTPDEFLQYIQEIEKKHGRIRKQGEYTSRPIDIDIIFFGNQCITSEQLTIPHPLFRDRKFVLAPLNDLGKDLLDPVTQLNVEQLLLATVDKSPISLYEKGISAHD